MTVEQLMIKLGKFDKLNSKLFILIVFPVLFSPKNL